MLFKTFNTQTDFYERFESAVIIYSLPTHISKQYKKGTALY